LSAVSVPGCAVQRTSGCSPVGVQQHLAGQREGADLRVQDRLGAVAHDRDVVPFPQLAELIAGLGQVADEGVDLFVVRAAGVRGAQVGDVAGPEDRLQVPGDEPP